MDSDEFRSLTEDSSKVHCSVSLDDGTKHQAMNITLTEDTTTWFGPESGEATHIPTERIQSITFVSRREGFIEGMFFGFVLGASVGAVWGYASGEDGCGDSSEWCFTHWEGLFFGGFLIGVPAAAIGSIIGAARGARHVYYPFPDESIPDVGDDEDWDPW
jgi:hypothetical protein